jgi:hypothetical protein
MIPQYSIQEWHEQVPWNTDAMVEQDLIICRALISIFSEEFLTDVEPLLRPEVAFNPQEAYQFLYDKVIEKMIVPAT